MAKKPSDAAEVVAIRVPTGLPAELRQLTGMPFSTLMRYAAVTMLNNERKRLKAAAPTTPAEESKK